ncbi:hypothetical protein Tco_0655127, partial [Tanacetum coccineum]
FVSASLVFFSPSVGGYLAAEGTSLVVALDAFSTTMENLFKVSVTLFNRLGRESKDVGLDIVEVKVSSFVGISFKFLVGKQLAKLCEAKSLESSGFKEVTRRSVTHPSRTEVIEPRPLTLEFEPILKIEDVGLKCLQGVRSDESRSCVIQDI